LCFNGAQPFQQNHRAATLRAKPERRCGITFGSRCVGRGGVARDGEQLAAERQQGPTAPVTEPHHLVTIEDLLRAVRR
jgi:hypothetical protein